MAQVIAGSFFDIGGREIYEDRVGNRLITTEAGIRLNVAMVADGVGGANKGERAAQIALDTVYQYLEQSPELEIPKLLTLATLAANHQVHAEVKRTAGASCTLTIAAITEDNRLYIANVGDSRVYLCRNQKLSQLTMDHSFANVMAWQGKMSREVAAQNPRAEVLMRALGPRERINVDIGFYVGTDDYQTAQQRGMQGLELQEGDSIIVCSDGLIKESPLGIPYAKDEEIIQVLTTQEGQKAAQSLVSFALGRDADDNVSVAVLQMPDRSRRRRAARRPLMLIGAGLLALVLTVGLISILLNRNASQVVEEGQQNIDATASAVAGLAAANQAAQEEFQLTSDAFELTVAASSDGENREALLATQAALEQRNIELANEQATNEAVEAEAATAQAVIDATNSAETPTSAIVVTCTSPEDFSVAFADEPILSHEIGQQIPSNNAGQLFFAQWEITNTSDDCELSIVSLVSTVDETQPRQELTNASNDLIDTLAPGSTALLTVFFDNDIPTAINDEWLLQVRNADNERIMLSDENAVSLDLDQWIVAVEPQATPIPVVVQPTRSQQQQPNFAATQTRNAQVANFNATQTAQAQNAQNAQNAQATQTRQAQVNNFNATQTAQARINANNAAATQTAQANANNARATQTAQAAADAWKATQTAQAAANPTPRPATNTPPPPTATPRPPATATSEFACDVSDPNGDADNDGKTNGDELSDPRFDPCDPDSDDDGTPDGIDLQEGPEGGPAPTAQPTKPPNEG